MTKATAQQVIEAREAASMLAHKLLPLDREQAKAVLEVLAMHVDGMRFRHAANPDYWHDDPDFRASQSQEWQRPANPFLQRGA